MTTGPPRSVGNPEPRRAADIVRTHNLETEWRMIIDTAEMTTTPFEFTITAGHDEASVTGRLEAVRRAKELSGKTWRPVYLVRSDQRVRMRFGKGVLVEYGYDTQPARGGHR